jgi:hypothetical protein
LFTASWSQCGDKECIRISGVEPGVQVQVRPQAHNVVGHFPAMAGRPLLDGGDVCFIPRYAFMPGTPYAVAIDNETCAVLIRPERHRSATTEVLSVHPTAAQVPRNLLRFYVAFSGPMSEGYAAEHLRLVDEAGQTLDRALLATDYELWDGAHRRLTVLLDPARIKRGLMAQRQSGYPLRTGQSFRIVIGAGFRDAGGAPLRAEAHRRYEVGADERRRVEPDTWTLRSPLRHSLEPLEITFDRPLDHALIRRCLSVIGPTGRPITGKTEIGPAERSWRLVPTEPWGVGPHELVVNEILEDVSGNSVTRVFDRDQTGSDDTVREDRPYVIRYFPR